MLRLFVGMLVVAAMAACGSSGGGGVADGEVADLGPARDAEATSPVDADAELLSEVIIGPEKVEVGSETVTPFEVKELDAMVDAGPGLFDLPCESNADCPTGICVYTSGGKRCSIPCVEDCPEGALCKLLPGGPDMDYACIPSHITTCRPCQETEGCQAFGFQPEGLCVNFSPEQGSFCVTPCSDKLPCPPGYQCAALPDARNPNLSFCQPESGECACDAVAVQTGLWTACEVGPPGAACQGKRTCMAEGLTPCDAPLPGEEQCDGKDNDCDGQMDEGNPGGGTECVVAGKKGLCAVGTQWCQGGELVCQQSYVALDEACDGQDNDCDGETDEGGAVGCTLYYLDKDGDGYGVESASSCLCAASGYYTALEAGDCDDTQPAAHPGAGEDCDGVDNDCDGLVDTLDPAIMVPLCEKQQGVCEGAKKPAWLCEAMEWKPCDAAVYAAHDPAYQQDVELECDGLDNDCDGEADDDFAGIIETCNGVDDDCNGKVDEGLLADYFVDMDGDLYGDETSQVTACFAPEGYIATGLDCDDSDPTVHPGVEETCDSKDNDCDWIVDSYFEECTNGCATGTRLCTAAQWGECDAPEPLSCIDWESCKWSLLCVAQCPVEPAEACNGLDDNCNGEIDEGVLVTFHLDNDGDGWGLETASLEACFAPPGYAGKMGDCDDNAATVHPEAVEVCDNLDNDCDGTADEGLGTTTCGLGICAHTVEDCVNGIPNPCDPFAGALTETCDGLDNDCDGAFDEDLGTTTCGKGLCEHTVVNCVKGVPQVCDPLQGQGPELCDGLDNDCDGQADQIFPCAPGQQDVEPCGQCGTQTRTCDNQCQWGPFGQCGGQGICTAGQQQSQSCGLCGTQYRTCNNQCQWDPWGTCQGQGPCSPGQHENQACGFCGTQSRTCNNQCQWDPWGGCGNQGVCQAGQQQTQGCGPCGIQTRSCNWTCQWDPWGGCVSQGICQPGQQESQSCGLCGTQYRYCNGSCWWDPWGSCQGQGVCSPGQTDTQTQSCGGCGYQTRTRTCDWSCQWGSFGGWSQCQGGGVCTPGQTETQTQSCGYCGSQTRSRACDANCNWGSWGSWGSCNGQGVCSPGTTSGSGCDACAQKSCQANCQWGSCALKPGAQCTWENGTHWKCCGTNKWKFCLSPTYGCVWSDQCVTCGGCGCP